MPPISGLTPGGARDLLWEFAYSEIASVSRHGDFWRKQLNPPLSERLHLGQRDRLTQEDWVTLKRVLLQVRGTYVAGLLEFPLRWSRGTLPWEELGEVKLIRLDAFRALAPSLSRAEFVVGLDDGRETPDDHVASRYRALRPRLDPVQMRGVPILVAESEAGPYNEVDGLTRMSILYSRLLRQEPIPASLGVLLGVSSRIREWPFCSL